MIIGLLLLLMAAFERLFLSVPLNSEFVYWGIFFKLFLLGLNVYFWTTAYRIAKSSESPIMEAQWRASRMYAYGNVVVLISLISGVYLENYPWAAKIDPIATFIMIAVSVKSFATLIKTSLSDLLDKTLSENIQLKILRRLSDYEFGYQRFYDVSSRKSGGKILIDITLGFSPELLLGDALVISHRIKELIEYDIKNSEVNVIINSVEEFTETIRYFKGDAAIESLNRGNINLCLDLINKSKDNKEAQTSLSLVQNAVTKPTDSLTGEELLKRPICRLLFVEDRFSGFSIISFPENNECSSVSGKILLNADNTINDIDSLKLFVLRMIFDVSQPEFEFLSFSITLPNGITIPQNQIGELKSLSLREEKDNSFTTFYFDNALSVLYTYFHPAKSQVFSGKEGILN